ncbi:SFRS4_5_6 [Mytilus edulis]|uniref:SFRS4_5_6 n=1 Tax=Mytilus edulis TaxID=6550 RepID=A0A8S3UGX3_MYTED|nr:SFRS4_5_6 [Mytilus edulis]
MADTHGSIKLLLPLKLMVWALMPQMWKGFATLDHQVLWNASYLQEIGRAGRDGRQSSAYMHYNMSDIATNTIVQPEVREFCLLKTCRRKFLSQYFETKVDLDSILKHNCCDVCEKECECDHCLVSEVEKFDVIDNCQCADEPDCTQLKEMLESYFNAENDQINMLNQQLVTGLTQTLCDKIVLNYKDIKCEEDIQGLFPYVHLKQHYLSNILLIQKAKIKKLGDAQFKMGTRVYIGRLSYHAREKDVERFFKGFGKVRDVMLKNGYGFVEFEDHRDADDAVYELNGKDLCGERISLEHARGTPRNRNSNYSHERDYGNSGNSRRPSGQTK